MWSLLYSPATCSLSQTRQGLKTAKHKQPWNPIPWTVNELCCFPHLEAREFFADILCSSAKHCLARKEPECFQTSMGMELTAFQNGSQDRVKSFAGGIGPGLYSSAEIYNWSEICTWLFRPVWEKAYSWPSKWDNQLKSVGIVLEYCSAGMKNYRQGRNL